MTWSQFSADMAEARHQEEDLGTQIPEDFRPVKTQTGDAVTKVIAGRANFRATRLWNVPWLDTELRLWIGYRNRDN